MRQSRGKLECALAHRLQIKTRRFKIKLFWRLGVELWEVQWSSNGR